MSASLMVFDVERHDMQLPTTIEEFGTLVERLMGKKDTANPRFIELAEELAERLSPEGSLAGVAMDDPVAEAQRLGLALWHMELPHQDAFAVTREIVEIAGAMGLAVLSDQTGVGFLPGDRVVPDGMAQIWQANKQAVDEGEEFSGASAVAKALSKALAPPLEPFGFMPVRVKDRDAVLFERKLGPVRQQIWIWVLRARNVELKVFVFHDQVERVRKAAFGEARWEIPALQLNAEFFYQGPDSTRRTDVRRPSDIPGVARLVISKLVPFTDLCVDLHGMDQVLNDPGMAAVHTTYRTMHWGKRRRPGADGTGNLHEMYKHDVNGYVVAHLDGNPQLPELSAEMERHAGSEGTAKHWVEHYRKVRDVLTGVSPLAHWEGISAWKEAHRPIPQGVLPGKTHPLEGKVHNWEVTAILLQRAETDALALWDSFSGEAGATAFQELWQKQGETLPEVDRIDAAGLSCTEGSIPATSQPAIQLLCMVFPAARGCNDCAIFGLARHADTIQWYVLKNEHAVANGKIPMEIIQRWRLGGGSRTRGFKKRIGINELMTQVASTFYEPTF